MDAKRIYDEITALRLDMERRLHEPEGIEPLYLVPPRVRVSRRVVLRHEFHMKARERARSLLADQLGREPTDDDMSALVRELNDLQAAERLTSSSA